jgi:hypothetical protein
MIFLFIQFMLNVNNDDMNIILFQAPQAYAGAQFAQAGYYGGGQPQPAAAYPGYPGYTG